MCQFRIDASNFRMFVNHLRLKNLIEDAVLEFEKFGLMSRGMDRNGIVFFDLRMTENVTVMKKGIVPIGDLKKLYDVLKRFSGEIYGFVKKNQLTLKQEDKTATVILDPVEYITTYQVIHHKKANYSKEELK